MCWFMHKTLIKVFRKENDINFVVRLSIVLRCDIVNIKMSSQPEGLRLYVKH